LPGAGTASPAFDHTAGPDAGQLTISGNHASRVFEVAAAKHPLSLSGLTIRNGDGVFAANRPARIQQTQPSPGGLFLRSHLAATPDRKML
jgi:hypothetical protein